MKEKLRYRVNNQITAKEIRLIDEKGVNLGVVSLEEALRIAQSKSLDLVEISSNVVPPVVKIVDFGKFLYEENKKLKKAKAGAFTKETKTIQIKVSTSDHDLSLKAKQASQWLKDGHRVKISLFLGGRYKYMDQDFLKGRLERLLNFISEEYKISEPYRKTPQGMIVVIEKK